MAVPEYHRLEAERVTEHARINKVVLPLTNIGVNGSLFHIDVLNARGFTANIFLKEVNGLVAFKEEEMLCQVFQAGVHTHKVKLLFMYPLDNIISLCRWMKTKEGGHALTSVHKQQKISAPLKTLPFARCFLLNFRIW